jgi:uncharacterized protein (TIGR02145 family)
MSFSAFAQAPNLLNYQGVARNAVGNPLPNQSMKLRLSIHDLLPSGAVVYSEIRAITTNLGGLFSVQIGSAGASSSTGTLGGVNWVVGNKFLQVELDPASNNNYIDIGTVQLVSVPYAFGAGSAATVKTNANLTGVVTSVGNQTSIANGAITSDMIGTLNKSKVGLDLVNNTSDAAKPISTATQAALGSKLAIADSTTGYVTPAQLATKTFDQTPITNAIAGKLNISDSTNGYVTPAQLAAKTFNQTPINSAIAGKLNISDSTNGYVTPAQLAAKTFDQTPITTAIAGKLSIADSTNGYVTPAQLAAKTFDTTSISNRINLKANITSVNTALALKAPLASPTFSGVVAIGTNSPAPSAVLDITSTSQGLLLPRLTYAQKMAIVSPVAGLVFWCTDCGTNGEMQVYNGTAFVNMVGGVAQFSMPSIAATTGVYSITSSSATSGGEISSDGGAAITARGIVWGTSTAPTIALVTKTTDGTGTGTYSSTITGLTPGVTYYVRAYATNSVGTKYGTEISFNTALALPTLATTTTASSIGATTAISGGNITFNGGATVTVSGVVWSTISTPTIALTTKTTDGAATGTYTSSLTGLTPGTLYYVRSYATNSVGTNYGAQINFTTLNTATISATASATSITSTSAISGATITADGGAAVTARGLVYGTSSGASTFSATSGTGTGTYTSSLTGLSPATTYFVRAFATNSVGTVYGTETSFTTIAVEPTVSATVLIASITGSSATSGGTISSNGGSTVTLSGIVWSTTSTPTIALLTKTTNGSATGTYTSSLTGLAPATLYYVRAYATNSIGTSYGPERSFTTLAIAPTISATSSAISITSSTATIGGTITADGGAAVTSRGVVYGTSAGSATYSVTSGTGTGTYTISLTGLTPATTYFVRSFATNSVGTVYGTETSFTTLAIAPTLTTTAAGSITKYGASGGATITSNGGSAITVSGICWSTTATPTTSDSKTTDGTTSGTFTSTITGLTAGTTYYVRAYATNPIGTSYGANQSFTTLSTPLSQTSVLIGTQTWTDKNLNVANYRNGDPITYAADASQWVAANTAGVGAYTYLKFASGDGGATYGKLYNWYAVNDSRGLAPTGYHIPTLTEWRTLKSTKPDIKTLKSTTSDWEGTFSNVNNNITVALHPNYSNYNGNNSSGFNALPGGSVFNTGTNGNYGSASFWTATQDGSNPLRAEWTYFHQSGLLIGSECCATENIQTGMSIRLVKDNNGVETSPINPILASTTSATSITANSAILGGNITDEGATQVSARGLVYGTTTGSSTLSVTVGSGGGTFTSTLTGLTQGTTYYVRSFATNAQGTSYGAETSFTTQTTPTVSVTATPTSITTTTAIGGGTISSTGGATITTSGLVWDASANPTIALSTKTTNGTTSGTFTSSITGLTQGTTYHVRAYATNYLGISYGPNITFTTITTPIVSTTATVTSITGTTATSGGTITVDGGATVTSRGVVWGTTTGSSTFSATSGTGTGTYLSNLSGLSIATNYFVRAFATNTAGTAYGPEVQFATPNTATVASTITSTITSSTAILGGVLSSTGGATTTIGIMYSTASNFGTFSTTSINLNAVAGTYTTSISGLSELTTYYAKAFATNTAGTTYGPTINFSTPVLPLTVGTTYQGGIIFYLFQSGEPGYVAGQTHGLIASTSDQSTYTDWKNNGGWNDIATGTGIGTGLANTNAIISSHGSSATYAAGRARAHNGGGYTDWYLPSRDELYKMHISIGQGANNIANLRSEKYWSSSQYESHTWQAYYMYAQTGNIHAVWKDVGMAVRAIRTF